MWKTYGVTRKCLLRFRCIILSNNKAEENAVWQKLLNSFLKQWLFYYGLLIHEMYMKNDVYSYSFREIGHVIILNPSTWFTFWKSNCVCILMHTFSLSLVIEEKILGRFWFCFKNSHTEVFVLIFFFWRVHLLIFVEISYEDLELHKMFYAPFKWYSVKYK